MKNANSRFVRVLAVALVVLMVLPAALVGCGSNKANDAAISEALAAAQAAKDAADKAQQKAEAAQKELEEANKKAEQLEAELEALKTTKAPEDTTAPVTTPVNKQEVIVYGIDAVAAIAKDLEATGKIGKTAVLYAKADWQAIEDYKKMTEIAINKAATIDEITEIVEAFYAYVEAMPTYAERVYEAYKAIDFASDLDVVDVVYAYNYLVNTKLYNGANALGANEEDVVVYGEEELNLVSLISTEYYRYTGKAGVEYVGDIKPLYKDIYTAADAIDAKQELIDLHIENDEHVWGIENILYTATVQKDAEDLKEAIENWYDRYFKDEALEANYEAFRQAFVGEDVILDLNKTEDALWPIVLAAKDRADVLDAAHEEFEDSLKLDLAEFIGFINSKNIEMDKEDDDYIVNVLAALDAELAAFFAEYDLGNPANEAELLVIKSVASNYADYASKALVVSYLLALEKTAASLDADAYEDAYDQYRKGDLEGRFDFAQYGAVVFAVNDWYNKFIAINPISTPGYEKYKSLGTEYAVSNLLTASFMDDIFNNVFDEDRAVIADRDVLLFPVYEALKAKKGTADAINLAVEKFLAGVTKKDKDAVKVLLGDDVSVLSEFFAETDDEDRKALVSTLGGLLAEFFNNATVLEYDDANSDAMIDWADLEQLSDNFDAMKAEAKDAAAAILDIYLRTEAYVDVDGKVRVDFEGEIFELKNTKTLTIDVYAYETVKALAELVKKVDVNADIFAFSDNLTFTYIPEANSKYEFENYKYVDAYKLGETLMGEFHAAMQAVEADVLEIADALPVLTRPKENDTDAFWSIDAVDLNDKVAAKAKAAAYAKAILDKHHTSITNVKTDRKAAVREFIEAKIAWIFGEDRSDYYGWYLKASLAALEDQTGSSDDFYNIGFYDAVISVNPVPFFTIVFSTSGGQETDIVDTDRSNIDGKGYIAALEAALDKNFAKFSAKFAAYAGNESHTAIDPAYAAAINDIVEKAFAYDLWEMKGAIDRHTYSIDASIATAPVFKLYDKKGNEVADKTISLGEFDGVEVKVVFDVAVQQYKKNITVDNNKAGAYYVKATVVIDAADATELARAKDALKAAGYVDADYKDLLLGELGFDAEKHTYDVRDAAAEIGANFAKFAGIKKTGSEKTYVVATEAQLQAIFDAEEKAYNNYEMVLCRVSVYDTENGDTVYGSYVDSVIPSAATAAQKDALLRITVKYKDLLSGKTLDEAREIVANFKNEVNTYLGIN